MVAHHLSDALHHDLDHHGTGHHHPDDIESHSQWKSLRSNLPKMVHGVHALKETLRVANKKRLLLRTAGIVGCGSAAILPVEFILARDKQGMQLVTLSNYVFAIASSWFAAGSAVFTERKIPIRYHVAIVLTAYGFNELMILAFDMGLAMPVALVVKNGGLLCQMFVGVVLGQRYTLQQLASGIVVTAGIILVVRATARPTHGPVEDHGARANLLATAGPALVLFGGMLSRSIGNAITERVYSEFGKQYYEVLFYEHALGLPLLFISGRYVRQVQLWTTSFPILYACLAACVVVNFFCKRCCTEVVGLSSSVVLNLILTVQRFLSIVASELLFHTPPLPPALLWVGAVVVIAGCTAYVLSPKGD